MLTGPRPLIAVPARFSATTSALRFAGEVNARALVEAVWRAGGEPATIHPRAPGGTADPAEVAACLERFDGVLLPGGGDLDPRRYGGGPPHTSIYDVDAEQDGFDLELARRALDTGVPLLASAAVGLQITATAADGTVEARELPAARGWFTAGQWHPENTAHRDPAQQGLFDALVRAARERR
ncbi:gamma-glutamyl-gamma-aminobutyrate hydrolase family protein [Streptomyces coffeae]|uniref:Gamma-glutamyl-gamma-aminobutyrate hydrolase family protein n=1 Tax=Streptomyces coffeae TaxID=621382 RepID=A0ABS1NBY8_9ACTN|nr:gamma-glutamyl-gamma-aminobutyrate hydrolase family protein [Streptomyces coffeae]